MAEAKITRDQLKRLQVLYGQLSAHTMEDTREARLAWAAQLIGHQIASFSELTLNEARHLIDAVQGQLGVKHPTRRRRSGEASMRHGKDGRRDGAEFSATPQIVSASDLETIEQYYSRLGWTRDRFDAWLHSPYSPLKKGDPVIRTKAEANKVRWALKGMLQNHGLWEERKPA